MAAGEEEESGDRDRDWEAPLESRQIPRREATKEFLRRTLGNVRVSLSQLTVEPIVFLVYLGWIFGNTIQSPGLYRRICHIYYAEDPYVNCYHLDDNAIEDKVQAHAAEWSLYNAIAYLVPAVFADTILGAFGDKYGRQMNIVLGIAGIAVSEYSYMLTLSESAATPYWTTTVVGLFSGLTGYLALVPVSCNAYLADITEDSELLTIRSGIFSVAQAVASVVGGVTAAAVNGIQIPIAVDIELLMYLFAIAYTVWRIPQRPGMREIERKNRVNTLTSTSSQRPVQQVKSFFHEVWSLLRSGFRTYTRRRIGHRRSFMFLTAITLMLTYTTSVETRMSPVLNSYVFRRAGKHGLDWDAADLGYWNGVGYLVLIFGTLLGLFLFKKVVRLPETLILIIAVVSSSVRTAIIAFATEDWHMYLANVAGIFAGLVQPATVSFIVQIVPAEEVGQAFSLFGIGGDLSFILANVLYSNIYRATVNFFPGFLFLFITVLQLLAGLSMLWVHVQATKEGVFVQHELPKEVQRVISYIGSESVESTPKPKVRRKMGHFESIYDHALQRGRMQEQHPVWGSLENMREHGESFY